MLKFQQVSGYSSNLVFHTHYLTICANYHIDLSTHSMARIQLRMQGENQENWIHLDGILDGFNPAKKGQYLHIIIYPYSDYY